MPALTIMHDLPVNRHLASGVRLGRTGPIWAIWSALFQADEKSSGASDPMQHVSPRAAGYDGGFR